MRLIKRFFWLLVLALVALFAINNMELVPIAVDPIGLEIEALKPMKAPLMVIILASLAIGLVVGVALENDRGREVRRDLRRKRQQVSDLQRENQRMHEAMKRDDHPDSAGLPARRF